MNESEQKELIRLSIRKMVEDMVPVQTFYATVKFVDWDAKTMMVVVDELEMTDVLLSIDGSKMDVKKPKVGSNALLGIIDNEEQALFMIWCSEYEEWHLNGDANGGLVNWPKAKTELEKLTARVDLLFTVLENAAAVTGSGDGGTGLIEGIQTALVAANVPKESFNDLENEKIKHG